MPPDSSRSSVSLDFETYSEAGYVRTGDPPTWSSISPGKPGGLPTVGAHVYAAHPSTEVLVACYQFDGQPVQTWVPGMDPPADLLAHVRGGGLVLAFNSMFEYLIWTHVCVRRYEWPVLLIANTRDTMACARAYGLPGKLESAAKALGDVELKDTGGSALIRRFSVPRNPTAKLPLARHYLGHDHRRAQDLYRYCAQDVTVERAVLRASGGLPAEALDVWKLDQRINLRGVRVDTEAIDRCQHEVDIVVRDLTTELVHITGGVVTSPNQVARIMKFCEDQGAALPGLDMDVLESVLSNEAHPAWRDPVVLRVLEIRRSLSAASVKKLRAIKLRCSDDGRVRGLFVFQGAGRTGRWAGRGPQPHNLPRGNAAVAKCNGCDAWQGAHRDVCAVCGIWGVRPAKWCFPAAQAALSSFQEQGGPTARERWGDVLGVVAGCLRSLFVAAPGHRFVCSDYRAIEAVVLAAIAGEDWRTRVFQSHGKIYEQSASKITGVPFDAYMEYRRVHGEHHPDRQKIGKVAELASGYQGWVNAWKRFGADAHMSDAEIEDSVKKWRAESPMIVALWRGLERAAIEAITHPGHMAQYRSIRYHFDRRVLRCYLPSGRALVYHTPSLKKVMRHHREHTAIKFFGHNSNHLQGPIGWVEQDTYGGRLTENVVQAISLDLLANGMLNVERAGYPVVLHVHDEIVCEIPDGRGSVEELERLMGVMPSWAQGWPVIAHGGWEGREYRKD